MINKKHIAETLGYLSGFFREVYVGGSYALYHSKLVNLLTEEPKDVDIFILGPKQFETWALEFVFNNFFDNILFPEYEYKFEYNIDPQFKRYIGEYKGITFDINFINTDIDTLINELTYSSLSVFYYKWVYTGFDSNLLREKLTMYKNARVLTTFVDFMSDVVRVNPKAKTTDKHKAKLENRASENGLNIINVWEL